MKTSILTLLAISLFAFSIKAQQVGNWGPWITVYPENGYPSTHHVQISFMQNPKCLGYSYYRTRSDFSIENAYVSFTYDYLDCDGKLQSEGITVLLDTPKVDYSATGTWYIGAKIVTPFRNVVSFLPPPLNSNIGSTSGGGSSSGSQTSSATNAAPNNAGNATNNANNTNNTGLTALQLQTQQYINNAQNPSADAIQQALALSQARIEANVRGGSTLQQREQIQQAQQQQSQSNSQAITSGITQIGGAVSDYLNNVAQQKQMEERVKEEQERWKELAKQQKEEQQQEIMLQKQQQDNQMMDYYNKGLQENKDGSYTDAITDFTNAVNLAPDVSVIYYHRANSYLNVQQFSQAKSDCDMAINLYPDSADYYLLRGYINYTDLKDNAGALADLTRADVLKPGNAAILNLKGEVTKAVSAADYLNKGIAACQALNYAEGIKHFYRSIELDPNKFEPYLHRGVAEFDLFQNQSAIKDFTKAIAIAPNYPWGHFRRAVAYFSVGEFQLAVDDWGIELANSNNNGFPANFLANILESRADCEYFLHQYQKVIDDCNSAIARNPGFADTYLLRGKTYLKKLNNKDAAMLDFNKVLQLDTSKTSDNFIYCTFYTGGANTALQDMQYKLSIAKTPFALINADYDMACLLSLIGRRTEALTYLKKAVAGGVEKKYIIHDDDFDNIRNTQGYLSLVRSRGSR